jgi:predicted DNA-binding transcriptional regulator AlpA
MSNKSSSSRQRIPAQPDRVLTVAQFAEMNSLGLRTAKRLIAAGNGPPILQLTSKRIGIRETDAARWQAARLRGQSA